nr:hypothetical protein EC90111_2364 [Escherichia coli 9.0111]
MPSRNTLPCALPPVRVPCQSPPASSLRPIAPPLSGKSLSTPVLPLCGHVPSFTPSERNIVTAGVITSRWWLIALCACGTASAPAWTRRPCTDYAVRYDLITLPRFPVLSGPLAYLHRAGYADYVAFLISCQSVGLSEKHAFLNNA